MSKGKQGYGRVRVGLTRPKVSPLDKRRARAGPRSSRQRTPGQAH